MEKNKYIESLKKYTNDNGISIYDYYYQYAVSFKNGQLNELPVWEKENPFLNEEDFKRLKECNEEDICKYFALAMEKTISLNVHELVKKEDVIDREAIEEIINEEMNLENKEESSNLNEDEVIDREAIEEIINEEMNLENKDEVLDREAIEEVVNDELDEDKRKPSKLGIFFMNIGKKISDLLNGFAVIRNENLKQVDLYYYDAKNEKIGGKETYSTDQFKAETGIYVNYQEYLDQLSNSVVERFPGADKITFVNEDREEKSFFTVAEEVYDILYKARAIRFGEQLKDKNPRTYHDYIDLNVQDSSYYYDFELRNGLYVRKDLLDSCFSKYNVRATFYNDDKEENNKYVK